MLCCTDTNLSPTIAARAVHNTKTNSYDNYR